MPENVGRMDRRIVVEEYTSTLDGYGETVKEWSTYATVWARNVVLPKGEIALANQQVAVVEVSYRIRHLPGINERMRIVDGEKYYYITKISEIGRNVAMMVYAEWRDSNS